MDSRVAEHKNRPPSGGPYRSPVGSERTAARRPPLAAMPDLREDEIHVWCARLDLGEEPIESLAALLASEEAERASRFHFARDRDAFAAARGILRTLLGGYLAEPPEQIRFAYGEFGKPSLARRGYRSAST
jgi:hypothetical protein